MGLVTPEKDFAQTYEINPANTRMQLRKGCLSADGMMVATFGTASMAAQCETDFPE
jgi:hypothetical protein